MIRQIWRMIRNNCSKPLQFVSYLKIVRENYYERVLQITSHARIARIEFAKSIRPTPFLSSKKLYFPGRKVSTDRDPVLGPTLTRNEMKEDGAIV